MKEYKKKELVKKRAWRVFEKKERSYKIEDYFPVGYAYQGEIRLLVVWLIGSIIKSFSFFYRYYLAYQRLWEYVFSTQEYRRRDGVFMEEFSILTDGVFRGFLWGFLLILLLGGWHYWYYYRGSKSIYLVKRLSDRWYCLKSCIGMPVIAGIVFFVFIVGLYGIYFVFYKWVTPKI